jgi:hypothetical protein
MPFLALHVPLHYYCFFYGLGFPFMCLHLHQHALCFFVDGFSSFVYMYTKWNSPHYQPGTLPSIYSTAVVGLRSLLLLPLLKKEIAAAGGWGVTEYLQLDWMDDGMDGWKAS